MARGPALLRRQHGRRLRRARHGLRRIGGGRPLVARRRGTRLPAQRGAGRHGLRLAVPRALGGPVGAPAAGRGRPRAGRRRHDRLGLRGVAARARPAALRHRPGHRRHHGEQLRDRRGVRVEAVARPRDRAAVGGVLHRCGRRRPDRRPPDSRGGLARGLPPRRAGDARARARDTGLAARIDRFPGLAPARRRAAPDQPPAAAGGGGGGGAPPAPRAAPAGPAPARPPPAAAPPPPPPPPPGGPSTPGAGGGGGGPNPPAPPPRAGRRRPRRRVRGTCWAAACGARRCRSGARSSSPSSASTSSSAGRPGCSPRPASRARRRSPAACC